MRISQYVNGQYLDQVALNLIGADAASGAREIANAWALPGLIHPEALVWSVSGTMLTVACPGTFQVQFTGGIIASALGTAPGSSGSTYNIQLSGFIPAAGSQTAYINASYFSLPQTQEVIVGPPQGNPAFNPNFAPFNFYTENVDSLNIIGSLTPPDNNSTFALAQMTLTAGMTGITLGQLSYGNQVLSSRVLGVQTDPVLVNTTLTMANAGIIQNCMVSGTTISLPPANTSAGYPFIFHGSSGLGSGYATIQTYGSDTIQTGGSDSSYTQVSLAAGMTIAIASHGAGWLTSAQANNVPISWNASGTLPSPLSISTSGGVQTPYSITASGAANPNQLTTLAQVQMHSGVVGDTRNLMMNVPAASYTSTLTADEILVATMLGGSYYRLSNFNQTINLAVTGAGGMDTGAPPDSGYVALYAIYNPTTGTAALLATNATSAVAPSIYGGSAMPAGYTASALVSVWRTNSTGELMVGYQRNRTIDVLETALLAAGATYPLTELNIATAVPPNAVAISGFMQAYSTAASTGALFVYATSTMAGPQYLSFGVAGEEATSTTFHINLSVPQNMYYMITDSSGTPTSYIYLSSYDI